MSSIKLFESKKIRATWHKAEQKWYFSVADVVEALTDSSDVKQYIKRMRQRDPELNSYWGTICTPLEMTAADGKRRQVQCANVERMRGIAIRDELTDEWQKRGVKESHEFAILTAEISRATFGLTPSEHKEFKNLTYPGDNQRDHMTDLELIFTMLGEASTTEIARNKNTQGFTENKKASKEGGKIAGDARKALEKKSGRKVVSKQNFKELPEREVRRLNAGQE